MSYQLNNCPFAVAKNCQRQVKKLRERMCSLSINAPAATNCVSLFRDKGKDKYLKNGKTTAAA